MNNITVDTDSGILMRDVLRLMAQNPALEEFIATMLDAACRVVGADAAFYLVFDSPRLQVPHNLDDTLIPDEMSLKQQAQRLANEPYLSSDLPEILAAQFKGWLLVPVRIQDKTIGLLALLSADSLNLDDSAEERLMTLIDALQVMTAKARSMSRHEKLMTNQNEFVRIVSHDLRSPLTSIQGFASMLESSMVGELNEKQTQFVGKILSGVEQMSKLVDNIQDAGRYDTETGFYEMDRSPADLIEMLSKIVKNHLLPAEKQELTIELDTTEAVPIVNVDISMLERAVSNLVDNAIKYTPNGGEIRVGIEQHDNELRVFVRDNGYGISEENLKKLFRRHFRIRRREHKRIKGSGLGLFIVANVAQHHDGRAGVESVEGEGSTFYVTIPLSGENLISAAHDL